MDRIQAPDEMGFMILSEDRRLAHSGGDLKNNERIAKIIFQMKDAFDASSMVLDDSIHSITIQYEDHFYVVIFEPRRFLVVKRRISTTASI